jgi:type II secretory pathway component PulK
MKNDERGVALVIVLTIVALLTIIVMEFTYTVQLDQHRARNALNALQARLLARSGINLAEAFLARDAEPKYDAFSEDWYLNLQEFCSDTIEIEPGMRVKCDVEDESGKININKTRPSRQSQLAAQAGGKNNAPDAYLRDAIECIFGCYNVPVNEIGDQLREYWEQSPPSTDAASSTSSTSGNVPMPDFGSLEDFAAQFHIPTANLDKLRRVLTAQPANRLSRININTAPEAVLNAVIIGYPCTCGGGTSTNGDSSADATGLSGTMSSTSPGGDTSSSSGGGDAGGVIQEILSRQRDPDQPFDNQGAVSQVMASLDADRRGAMSQLFGVTSSYYRLQASALTNTDPSGEGTGGIGQTLSALVRRTKAPVSNASATDTQDIQWTFRLMDWQREAGARLFRQTGNEAMDALDQFNTMNQNRQMGLGSK